MKKGGNTNRYKPTDTVWENNFPNYAALFQKDGWFNFFKIIKGFSPYVPYRFAQGFVKDRLTFDTLKFELTDKLIVEATGIARDGELWFNKIPFTFNPKYFLLPEVEALDWGKGV